MNPNHVGPYDNTSAGARLVRMHRSMYVPPQLLPHIINLEDTYPMAAFSLIAARVQDLGLMQELGDPLVWLLACAT